MIMDSLQLYIVNDNSTFHCVHGLADSFQLVQYTLAIVWTHCSKGWRQTISNCRKRFVHCTIWLQRQCMHIESYMAVNILVALQQFIQCATLRTARNKSSGMRKQRKWYKPAQRLSFTISLFILFTPMMLLLDSAQAIHTLIC